MEVALSLTVIVNALQTLPLLTYCSPLASILQYQQHELRNDEAGSGAPELTESKEWMWQKDILVVVRVKELLYNPAEYVLSPPFPWMFELLSIDTPSTWRVKNIQRNFVQITIVCNLTIVWVKLIFLLWNYPALVLYCNISKVSCLIIYCCIS